MSDVESDRLVALTVLGRIAALHERRGDVCAECSWQPHSINGNVVLWPCPTMRAFGEAIEFVSPPTIDGVA